MLKLVSALVGAFALLATSSASAAPALAARNSDAAGVRVVVVPKKVEAGAAVWEFDVTMDTHTKPLTDDLAQIAVLVDDAGRRYRPASWKGDAPGGHHRKGTLVFSAPAAMPASIELQMSGIGGAAVRTFRWELK